MVKNCTQEVFNDIKKQGPKIEGLYLESCKLKSLPDDIFEYLPSLKWLDLR